MKKGTVLFLIILIWSSCATMVTWFKPKGFTYLYDGRYTGIDTLLNIDGYYYNDSTLEALLLYRDGTAAIAGMSDSEQFDVKNKDKHVYSPRWGVYRIQDDTIKVQTILNFGGMENMQTGFYTYIIQSKTEVELYVESSSYDLQKVDTVKDILRFYPYPNRLDSAHWVKKHKWFWNKEAYKAQKRKN